MRTHRLLVASLCAVAPGMWSGAFAQQLTKQPLPLNTYKQTSHSSLAHQEKVRSSYNKLEEVYVLDFTEARSKSVSAEMESSAAKVVRSAAYVDYSNKAAIGELLSLRPEALTVRLPFEGTILTIDLVQSDFFGENFKVQSNA